MVTSGSVAGIPSPAANHEEGGTIWRVRILSFQPLTQSTSLDGPWLPARSGPAVYFMSR